jgi:HEPN domain-containing protein
MSSLLANILAERDYPRELLKSAKDMITGGRHEIAVVTAQMACEICVERVLRTYFRFKEVTYLEDAIEDLLPSYNLANEKVRRIYSALTGDAIHQQYFWSEYKTMVSIRNKAVHAGARIQESQAQMVCRIASSVVKHLQAVEHKAMSSQSSPAAQN